MRIRTLGPDDRAFAAQLCDHRGHGFPALDLQTLITLEPKGCFIAEEEGRPVGLVTFVAYGKLGWIGNVVVSSEHRGRGCGRALLEAAVSHLLDRGARTVGLDATLQAVPFCTRARFRPLFEVLHMRRAAQPPPPPVADSLVPMQAKDLHSVAMFDWAHFGGRRQRVLRYLLPHSPVATVAQDAAGVGGYLMARPRGPGWIIGPWVCVRSAEALLTAALAHIEDEQAILAVPKVNEDALHMLRAYGFRVYYREMRMYYGDQEGFGHPQRIYAIACPEIG
ncbi:MAG: GNAT family N-acetyltransferase [Anaerolineae bacterium]|nr:GNAT family N-acetyltransferase [Anaerolineae bacterium]